MFDNEGVLRKSGGTNSIVSVPLNNFGGNIEINSGSLTLSGGGTSSNGTISVAANTVLSFAGAATWTWSGALIGSGPGQVQFNNGALVGTPLTLNFAPGVFQWVSDRMNRAVTNLGMVTLVSTNIHRLWDNPGVSGTDFYNAGTMRHAEGSLDLQSRFVTFHNLAPGTYDLTGDGDIISTLWNGAGTFENAGLLRKSGGANSVISTSFNNLGGTIEVDSGTLTLTGGNFTQNGGALKMVLSGRGLGQYGQLAVNGAATLSGSLNVTLGNGFVPAPGDKFPVLTSSGLSGVFDQVSVPPGAFLYYTNNTVSLVFSGQSNLPPSLQFSIVTPTNGVAPSGSSFEVDVHGSDDNGIGHITANLSG
ncbi:MAG: hypothetical protein ACREIC_34400, partial [Limisphaerales bacterium]